MIAPLGQDKGAPACRQRRQHVVADERVARLVLCQGGVECRNREAIRVHPRGQAEARLAYSHAMLETPLCGLGRGIDPVPHRTTLHEDDRVVPVFPGDRRGQPKDVPGL